MPRSKQSKADSSEFHSLVEDFEQGFSRVSHLQKQLIEETSAVHRAKRRMLRAIEEPNIGIHRLWLLFSITRVTTRESVEGAAQVIRELYSDRAAIQRLHENGPRTAKKGFADCLVRVERQLSRWETLLTRFLGVRITEFQPGDAFDPELQEVYDKVAVTPNEKPHTICDGQQPMLAFSFRDEFGRDQVIPASVSIYVAEVESAK